MNGEQAQARSAHVRTHGLTHVAIAVRDPQRSLRFYRAVLGVIPVCEREDFVQAQTPGSRDVLVFERRPRHAGRIGGIAHFGFRLRRAADIARARAAVTAAGGKIHDTGEFVPGEPYVFFRDPDGYEVEIWYELPTPVDPRRERSGASREPLAKRSERGRGERPPPLKQRRTRRRNRRIAT
jgi:catechol 2,3-dioxygenase-like lactoylglutathione lyase family enzyme